MYYIEIQSTSAYATMRLSRRSFGRPHLLVARSSNSTHVAVSSFAGNFDGSSVATDARVKLTKRGAMCDSDVCCHRRSAGRHHRRCRSDQADHAGGAEPWAALSAGRPLTQPDVPERCRGSARAQVGGRRRCGGLRPQRLGSVQGPGPGHCSSASVHGKPAEALQLVTSTRRGMRCSPPIEIAGENRIRCCVGRRGLNFNITQLMRDSSTPLVKRRP